MPKRAGASKVDAPSAAKRMRKLTPDQIVKKTLDDNFKNFSHEAMFVRLYEGLTLFDRIKKDKAEGKIVFGSRYYAGLRDMYRSKTDVMSALKPRDPGEVVRPELMRAMVSACRARPDRSEIVAFFNSSQVRPNHTEFVGVAKFVLNLKTGCDKQLAIALDAVRWFKRFDVHTLFAGDWHWLHDKCDKILTQAFKKATTAKMASATWIGLNSKLLALIMDPLALKAVVDCRGNYSTVETELGKLVSSTTLGMHLFGHAVSRVIAQQIKGIIDAGIEKLLGAGTVDETSIGKAKASITEQLQAIDNTDLLGASREIHAPYRGVSLRATVKNVQEELSWRISIAWKGLAVGQSKLEKLWCEDLVIGKGVQPGVAKVAASLAEAANAARRQVRTILAEKGIDTGDLVQKAIDGSKASLLCTDRDFAVELALFEQLAGASSEKRLQAHILDLMPTKEKDIAAETVLQSLTALSRRDVTKFANRQAQAKLQVCIKVVGRIVDSRPPDVSDIQGDPALRGFYERLPFFVRCKDGNSIKCGGDALASIVAKWKKATGEGPSVADVMPLKVFEHWLPSAVKDTAIALVAQVEDKAGAKLVKLGNKGGRKDAAASSSSEKQSDHAVLAAAAFFS